MTPGPPSGTSSLPIRATIGAELKQPSRALAGLLADARGERLTPSHAVKKGRRYRYYVSDALITEAGTDRAQGWRLPAQEIEDYRDQGLGRRVDQPGDAARALRHSRRTRRPNQQNAGSRNPPCSGPQ